MRLLLLADTHVPKRARDLPGEVWEAAAQADLVVHAGDWTAQDLVNRLQATAGRLLACYGNNDPEPLRTRLPEVARMQIEGLRLVVTHETGAAKGREMRVERRFPDADLLIFGHSHIPWDSTTPRGLRLLNPGSPTDRRRQPYATYMTVDVRNGAIEDVTLHRLPGR